MTLNHLTSPNIEKNLNVILNAFKRRNINLATYEIEALESVAKHIESSFNDVINNYSCFEKMVSLLMFHYVHKHGDAKTASFMISKDMQYDLSIINLKLKTAIQSIQTESVCDSDELKNASTERIEAIKQQLLNTVTQEQTEKAVKKLATDLLIRDNFF